MKTISIVIPVYCEELVIEEGYKRITSVMDALHDHDYELIFVDDGSTDNTLSILTRLASNNERLKIIVFSRNFGHQIAITAGLDKAQGDAVIIIDADLQDPPELIPRMIEMWENGSDVVFAKRVARKGEGRIKRWTASVFYRILDKLTDIKIPIDTGDFRLIDKKVVQEMKKIKECNRFVRGLTSWVGFKQTGIEYERDERIAGETKYSFRKMIKFGLDGIFSFSHKPLKLSLNVGILSIAIGMAMIVYVFLGKIFFPSTVVPGWSSILIAVVFFGGVQLFTIGIIGEYIARIYDEAKNRPLYIIRKEINFKR
jgi:glycosyltransferase involved in cell wall biosynthesis